MSTIAVEVVEIDAVRPHPNADALELATIKGWQLVVRKNQHAAGQRVVYFEAGTALPREVAERFGVAQYLSEKTDIDGERQLVVHRVKLRGEPSFGLAVLPDEEAWPVGHDVSAHYGASKYQPPLKVSAGDAVPDDPRFPPFTDVENMRSYPLVFRDGEMVEATEKVHGSNVRVGYVAEWVGDMPVVTQMAGSRGLRRKRPEGDAFAANTYWFPFSLAPVQALMALLLDAGHRQAVLYGEVFGRGVQSYDYGERSLAFRAFDLMLDGSYVDRATFADWCARVDLPTAPVLFQGSFSLDAIRAISDGDSAIGGAHGREGVVVRPLTERHDPAIGRAILKYVGDRYLFGLKQDFTDQ